ncbi:MAG: hypothetical protein J6T36_02350 [Campylobacter sp.]|nr:hypothetical protein [Campylobacter sp.]
MDRIKKAVKEYETRTDKSKGKFYQKDLIELMSMSNDKYELMFNSIAAAYIIGYRAAMREKKKK